MRRALALLAMLALATEAYGDTARERVDHVTIPTRLVPGGVRLEILVPMAWRPGDAMPLMVFLHDGRGDERSFRRHGLDAILAAMVREGLASRALVVSPRYRGTFLIDSPRGAMETFVASELVPAIERRYPGVGGSREMRVVWGISMGGYGALKLALRHPGVFGRAAALAPWVQTLSWDDYVRHRGLLGRWLIEPVFGRSRSTSRFEFNDLSRIAADCDPAAVPPLYVRTGSRDRWEAGAEQLEGLLDGRGIRIDARSVPGAGHDWASWRGEAAALFRWILPSETQRPHARRRSIGVQDPT